MGDGVRTAVIVDDDPDVRLMLRVALEAIGFAVHEADTGQGGVDFVRACEPDLVTLDLVLPGFGGVEVCRRIRGITNAYIMMISASADEADRLVGLTLGADDYVTKPFSPREVVARVRAVLRRRPAETETGTSSRLRVGRLDLDPDTRRAQVAGVPVELTTTEFDLLSYLMQRPGRVCAREELLADVWGYPAGTPTRTTDVHIAQLRAKLGDVVQLRTVRGVGYSIEP